MNCSRQHKTNDSDSIYMQNLLLCNSSSDLQQPAMSCTNSVKTTAIFIPMAVLTALINGLVFVLFFKKKKLRTPGNCILLSLAVSDFMTGTVNIPILISYCVRLDLELIRAFEVLCKLTAILTAYHILAVTVEKYIAIVKPLQHRSANPRNTFRAIGIIWIVSIVIAVLQTISNYFLHGMPNAHRTFVFLRLGHDLFCFVAVFLIPYIFIVYAQTVMYKAISLRINKTLSRLRRTKTRDKRNNSCISQDKKCLAIFAVMAILFVICWLPWFILSFCATMTAVNEELLPVMLRLEPVLEAFAIIRFTTCIINPILYTFFKRDFLEACKHIFHLHPKNKTPIKTSLV